MDSVVLNVKDTDQCPRSVSRFCVVPKLDMCVLACTSFLAEAQLINVLLNFCMTQLPNYHVLGMISKALSRLCQKIAVADVNFNHDVRFNTGTNNQKKVYTHASSVLGHTLFNRYYSQHGHDVWGTIWHQIGDILIL